MNPADYERISKAEIIINNYGTSLTHKADGIARPISYLKNSIQEIKDAYRIYISALVDTNQLTDQIYGNLSSAYSFIDQFIEDEKAQIINRVNKQKLEKTASLPQEEKLYKDFFEKVILRMAEKNLELDKLIEK
jgi:hypothetical protein